MAVLCFFRSEDGELIKCLLPYQPYFYVAFQDGMEKEVQAYLESKIERVESIELVQKVEAQHEETTANLEMGIKKLEEVTAEDEEIQNEAEEKKKEFQAASECVQVAAAKEARLRQSLAALRPPPELVSDRELREVEAEGLTAKQCSKELAKLRSRRARLEVALAVVAKAEVIAQHDIARSQALDKNRLGKLLRGHGLQIAREPYPQDPIDAAVVTGPMAPPRINGATIMPWLARMPILSSTV